MIKDHEVLGRQDGSGRKQAAVAYQLMTWLKFVGTEGSGGNNSNQRTTFKISCGAAEIYRRRVTQAIRSLKAEYIHWPSPAERKGTATG